MVKIVQNSDPLVIVALLWRGGQALGPLRTQGSCLQLFSNLIRIFQDIPTIFTKFH